MEEHDKGIALPEEPEEPYLGLDRAPEWSAEKRKPRKPRGDGLHTGWNHWSRSVRALDSLRSSGGQTAREVAKYIREPLSYTEVVLKKLLGRRLVQTEVNEEGETLWSIPYRQLKAHHELLKKQSRAAASFFTGWTCLAIAARLKAGIEIYGSYPYVLVREEKSSSTTTPLT